ISIDDYSLRSLAVNLTAANDTVHVSGPNIELGGDVENSVVSYSLSPFVVGDWNLDGALDGADIAAMMSALSNLANYKATHGLANRDLFAIGDIDRSGSINGGDIPALLNLILGGPAPAPQIAIDAGAGNDEFFADLSANPETMIGGAGNDVFDI